MTFHRARASQHKQAFSYQMIFINAGKQDKLSCCQNTHSVHKAELITVLSLQSYHSVGLLSIRYIYTNGKWGIILNWNRYCLLQNEPITWPHTWQQERKTSNLHLQWTVAESGWSEPQNIIIREARDQYSLARSLPGSKQLSHLTKQTKPTNQALPGPEW